MFLRSWPVRFFITRAARAYGFLDPVALVSKLRGFAQPSEVGEPIELLRAGMLFHARGLINTKAIQNNLDWVWPFWVERQFNPADPSFIPRAFSFSHINLTHRNWTAVGVPDVAFYPLVDPRGLVTPQFDGWSLDVWLLPENRSPVFPSKLAEFEQSLAMRENLVVHSEARDDGVGFKTEVWMSMQGGEPHCCLRVTPVGVTEGQLVIALRPYNPEGISSVEKIEVLADNCGWNINSRNIVSFDRQPARHALSVYAEGDVSHRLQEAVSARHVHCPVNMATAAAFFPIKGLADCPLEVRAPIYNELDPKKRPKYAKTEPWSDALRPLSRLAVADSRIQHLYDLAVANLLLHTPGEVYPGPFTYKRFWFRDAAFVLNALLTLGGTRRTRRALEEFAPRQRHDGYFLSQEGEWDSNGEAIWMYHRFARLTGESLPAPWLHAVAKGAKWIIGKRMPRDPARPEGGLLPAGFSAEHLGPNDFYYWDDFWGVAGLQCAAELLHNSEPELSRRFSTEAAEFLDTVEKSFPAGPQRRFPRAIPASPKRRMDSGAVGSLVADYPLQLFKPGDDRILRTADYLRDHSTYQGGFFQNMIHSGINAYLTLHLAQVRLRAGDAEAAWSLIERVADLASPTGQWPEAIHPRTLGGCMGDGQHIWAAGEWALMIRNCFVREERDRLVIGAGVPSRWIPEHGAAELGPTLTPWGPVTVRLRQRADGTMMEVHGSWRAKAPPLEFSLPGHTSQLIEAPTPTTDVLLTRLP